MSGIRQWLRVGGREEDTSQQQPNMVFFLGVVHVNRRWAVEAWVSHDVWPCVRQPVARGKSAHGSTA